MRRAPYSVQMIEGESNALTVSPDTGPTSDAASNDARSEDMRPSTHPAFLRLVEDEAPPPPADSLDGVALVTLMCEVKKLQAVVVRLSKRVAYLEGATPL